MFVFRSCYNRFLLLFSSNCNCGQPLEYEYTQKSALPTKTFTNGLVDAKSSYYYESPQHQHHRQQFAYNPIEMRDRNSRDLDVVDSPILSTMTLPTINDDARFSVNVKMSRKRKEPASVDELPTPTPPPQLQPTIDDRLSALLNEDSTTNSTSSSPKTASIAKLSKPVSSPIKRNINAQKIWKSRKGEKIRKTEHQQQQQQSITGWSSMRKVDQKIENLIRRIMYAVYNDIDQTISVKDKIKRLEALEYKLLVNLFGINDKKEDYSDNHDDDDDDNNNIDIKSMKYEEILAKLKTLPYSALKDRVLNISRSSSLNDFVNAIRVRKLVLLKELSESIAVSDTSFYNDARMFFSDFSNFVDRCDE
ncbi:hypothetical protein HT594_00057 [Phenacoccus solenopsis nudivirus]|nr:hypothetical protein HT594_00057 [Phenacoccus solenopsis nudivirus]